ncbi:MAG: hypothetical protein LBJ00_04695 [Planctomycetaceae bacterium]|nr:hypothetical protein [Planctomycetaceae bacterium]
MKECNAESLPSIYSSCFKIPEVEHGSVASRSGCSWAKPTAHTGSGITGVSVPLGTKCWRKTG